MATAALETIGLTLWGFRPRLMASIVERLGARGALRWFAANMLRYERTRAHFGPLRTHLLTVEISLLNGCTYCAAGHADALELWYLREHGELPPFSWSTLAPLLGEPPEVLRTRLRPLFDRPQLVGERAWFERLLDLFTGEQQAVTSDDRRIEHLVEMFAVLNACGIADRVEPDEAHDPINRHSKLRQRRAALRASQAESQEDHSGTAV